MSRTVRGAGILAGMVFAAAVGPLHAQVVPWLEPPAAAEPAPARPDGVAGRAPTRPAPVRSSGLEADAPARERRGDRRDRRGQTVAPAPAEEPIVSDPRGGTGVFSAILDPSPILLSGFSGGADDGAVRGGTTWVGQTAQNAGTVAVGGTARDDNGWSATRLSLDASGMSYLNLTAQRDPGHAAPTLFIQFEDLSLRTKVVSVGTAQFALGSMTVVQVPLTGWTVDFGPSQIVSWSLGGGSVGSVDFRMTFDELALTTTAIPEPALTALGVGLVAAFGCWRRRRTRRVLR